MKGILLRWVILAGAIMVASYLLEGIEIKGFFPALGAAAMLGILNAFLRPVLSSLTLPINILSLGLFTFVINALMLKMVSAVIPGFDVHGFWTAVLGSLIITLVNWLLNAFINERGRVEYIDLKKKEARPMGITDLTSLPPAMRQYVEIKAGYEDCILLFRMGDFYEMFFEDAVTAAKILDITLTSRDKGKEDSIPMCGFPYHAASSYISKLIEKGFKVAICEQVEDPKLAKGVVKREVVRVVTPGLVVDTDNLQAGENNYLAALSLCQETDGAGLSGYFHR